MPVKSFGALIVEEARKKDLLYSNVPYSCGIQESASYYYGANLPEGRMTITGDDSNTYITIKPIKGSGKRKPFVVHLWR